MPEIKLTTPLPEIDTARLRPRLRARPRITRPALQQTPIGQADRKPQKRAT